MMCRVQTRDSTAAEMSLLATGKSQWSASRMSLLGYRHNVASQYGEDGVITRIFEILQIPAGSCVEFGAWDGRAYSNTYNLIHNRGWRGVLIEGSATRFADLCRTYA